MLLCTSGEKTAILQIDNEIASLYVFNFLTTHIIMERKNGKIQITHKKQSVII